MKRKIFSLGFVFALMATCLVAFTACSSDDDESGDDNNSATLSATMTYKYEVSDELLSIADVNLNYTDENGDPVSESMSSTTWTKVITKTCPCEFSALTVTMALKSDFTAEKEYYTLGDASSYSLVLNTGQKVGEASGKLISKGIGADDLSRWFSEKATSTAVSGRSLDASGNIVSK